MIISANLGPIPAYTWWNGNDYHNNSIPQCKLAEEVLKLHTFVGNEKILDIGCGDGKVTCQIAKSKVPLGHVLGMDASPSMIENAIANNVQRNTSFQQGYAESFEIGTLFDIIVSFSALHWVPDQQSVWNNIRKHLKVGACTLVSLNPQPRNPDFTFAIEETIQTPKFAPYFHGFTERSIMPFMTIQEYENIILNAGLKIQFSRQSSKFFNYENKTALINNVKAWLPHVAQVPQELQNEFISLIITKFLLNTNQNQDGNVQLQYNNFMIQACRLN